MDVARSQQRQQWHQPAACQQPGTCQRSLSQLLARSATCCTCLAPDIRCSVGAPPTLTTIDGSDRSIRLPSCPRKILHHLVRETSQVGPCEQCLVVVGSVVLAQWSIAVCADHCLLVAARWRASRARSRYLSGPMRLRMWMSQKHSRITTSNHGIDPGQC